MEIGFAQMCNVSMIFKPLQVNKCNSKRILFQLFVLYLVRGMTTFRQNHDFAAIFHRKNIFAQNTFQDVIPNVLDIIPHVFFRCSDTFLQPYVHIIPNSFDWIEVWTLRRPHHSDYIPYTIVIITRFIDSLQIQVRFNNK